jgi:hypothetical protein
MQPVPGAKDRNGVNIASTVMGRHRVRLSRCSGQKPQRDQLRIRALADIDQVDLRISSGAIPLLEVATARRKYGARHA